MAKRGTEQCTSLEREREEKVEKITAQDLRQMALFRSSDREVSPRQTRRLLCSSGGLTLREPGKRRVRRMI